MYSSHRVARTGALVKQSEVRVSSSLPRGFSLPVSFPLAFFFTANVSTTVTPVCSNTLSGVLHQSTGFDICRRSNRVRDSSLSFCGRPGGTHQDIGVASRSRIQFIYLFFFSWQFCPPPHVRFSFVSHWRVFAAVTLTARFASVHDARKSFTSVDTEISGFLGCVLRSMPST